MRQNIHGRMRYRGSTSGAVTSCNVVVASQIRTKEVVAELVPSGSARGLARICADLAGFVSLLEGGRVADSGLALNACMHAHPHMM